MRGRDAIAVALRHPDGRIVWAQERLDSGFHGSRVAKLPFVRGLVVLYETLIVGSRWLVRSAAISGGGSRRRGRQRRRRDHADRHAGRGGRHLLPAAAVPGERDRRRPVEHRPAPRRRRRPRRPVHRLPAADLARRRRQARVPVPRRGAHDDPRAGARRPADDRGRPPLPHRTPALRHRVPGHRDHPVDPGVLADRPAGAGADGREPDRADPGHRRRRLRDPPVRGEASRQPADPRALPARHLGPDDHDEAAHRRHDRGRDRVDGAGAPGRRRALAGRQRRLRARAARHGDQPERRQGAAARRRAADRRRSAPAAES